ncbi:lipoprotein-releasing ABC transporter permease subunit [bacterium]|nr:lipoprotein-releasing ABC transporter permease subunit [bacterium]
MKNAYEFFVARRYLKARRKRGFINIITYITILGVTIGVAALIIVLSVMNGFEQEVRSRIVGFDGHIKLRTFHFKGMADSDSVMKKIADISDINGMSPYIDDKGILRSGDGSDGVMVRGVDPETFGKVSEIPKNIVYGEMNLNMAETREGQKLPGIIIGRWIADRLMVDIGDRVILISLKGVGSMFQAPPIKQFVVTGFFETGMYEFDNTFVYISLKSAQKLFMMGDKVSGIEIHLDNLYRADKVVKEIENRLGFPYYPQTWYEMRKTLFSWMQLEKYAAFLILCLIILVAAFNIISTLIMVVMEKTREIGILKSMGSSSKSITRIFLYQGLIVGMIGTLTGSIIGYGLCWIQQKYELFHLPGDVYIISVLPVKMQFTDFISIASAAVLICLAAALYPARRASQLAPVDAIRYE